MDFSDINVSLPGVVVSYDASTCRATVLPTISKRLNDGSELSPPKIVNVPVLFPTADVNGSVAQITVPIKPNDGVFLIFCQRSLENWLSGSNGAPDDPRMMDLSDAFAIPGCNQKAPSADDNNLSISYGEGSIKIAPSGEVTIKTPKLTVNAPISEFTGNVNVNGNVTAKGEVQGKGINLSTHKHSGDSGGMTGAPQ